MGKLLTYNMSELSSTEIVEIIPEKKNKNINRALRLAAEHALYELLYRIAPEKMAESRFQVMEVKGEDGEISGYKIEMLTDCVYES